ncbi:ATP-grasp domain-containing protein [Brevibacillus choshinensis]|uniref:ATP-grasp domain-containing protein n=1 Tax=Brevibacillus choshinensis TaxID=54911 RepID=UPI002E201AD7|nr:ATP-grasp domain-containing protein [Brevibacillus choshinensis]MED4779861.1 ATP-grasp domain-containing protein [Brevibacillus choshinensis]
MNTRKTVVLTGGRAPSTLELARLMDQAGHRVVMAESARFHLGRASRAVSRTYQVPPPRQQPDEYIQALKKIMEQEKADLLIPTCEEIFYVSRGLEQLVNAGRVLTEGIDVLRSLHDKWSFGQLAGKVVGATVPITKRIESEEQMREALKHASGSVVLKPVFSRFASQLRIVHDPVSASSGDLPAISKQQPWVVQEYIKGRQLCSYAVAHNGQLALYADYETTYTAGQGASIHFSYANHPGVREFVSRFVDVQQFSGQIAFDFMEDLEGKLYVIECNPRLTSGIHLFADQMQAVEAFFGKKCEVIVPRGNQPFMLGMAMLAYGLPAVRNVAEGKRWLRDYLESRDVLWRNSDPLPYFYQLRMLADLAKQRLQTGKSMLECSTSDIEWNGEE